MFRTAKEADLPKIMMIVQQIVIDMSTTNNRQWDETYPLREHFLQDIQTDSLYVLEEDDQLKGFISINQDFAPEYHELDWEAEEFLVIHRVAVNPKSRQEGVATRLMQFAEQLSKERGMNFLISDTSELNTEMNRLFNKLEYVKVGKVSLDKEEFQFNCYEKKLD